MTRRPFARFSFIILVFLLAACQVGENPTAAPPDSTRQAGTPAATLPPVASSTPVYTPTPDILAELDVNETDLKGKEVQFWHPLVGDAAKVLAEQASLFNRSNPWGLRVNPRGLGGSEALEEALLSAAAGEGPDVVLAPSELLTSWDAQDGRLADLTAYLTDEQWGMAPAERDGYDARYWNQDRRGDKQVGLPALRTALGLVYNRTFAADLGFNSAPKTPQQLREQACASAKDNNRFYPRYGTGGWMLDTRPLTALSWMAVFGARVEPEETDGAWVFNQPEAREMLGFLNEMQAAGCVWIPKYPTTSTYFSGRLAFLYTGTLQDLVPQQGAMDAVQSKDEWTMIPFPGQDGRGLIYAYGYSFGVVTSSQGLDAEKQMAAWLFTRWMSAKERLAALARAWPSLPVRADVRLILEANQGQFPWTVILPLADTARPAPSQPSWRVARRPLEDAFWQVFHLASAEQLDTILPMLDRMTAELLKGQ